MFKTNFGGARVHGVEMNVGWGIADDVVLQAGFVEQRARFAQVEPDFGSLDFFRTPQRLANATVTLRHVAGFDLFGGVRYTGPMLAPHYAGWIDRNRLERTHWKRKLPTVALLSHTAIGESYLRPVAY
jgi:outer membrane receptor for ferrienterochelin and colicins